MAVYVNLSAGVGKPLWEITLQEFSVWFKVRPSTARRKCARTNVLQGNRGFRLPLPSDVGQHPRLYSSILHPHLWKNHGQITPFTVGADRTTSHLHHCLLHPPCFHRAPWEAL